MANLLQPSWELDSRELRILLGERFGGQGQTDRLRTGPDCFYLPAAREHARVVLTYRDRRIVSVEPGPAFDPAEWDRIAAEIETSVLRGPLKTGRNYSFSSYRVDGSWRGERSRVQILPPHPEAPGVRMESAQHPFILEFPVRDTGCERLNQYRWSCGHRRITLVLNTLLAGWTSHQLPRATHSWVLCRDGVGPSAFSIRWAQLFYDAPLGEIVRDAPSPLSGQRLQEIADIHYYEEVVGIDGRGLRVPSDLDESICNYQGLSCKRREEFDRAAVWLDLARRYHAASTSASFAALVSAVEALVNSDGLGRRDRTSRFKEFLNTYAPGASLEPRRQEMYRLRSGILHGSELMELDEDLYLDWTPPWFNDGNLYGELWGLTRAAMRNWLKNPPP
jgi:hypothetical protein